VSRHADKLSEKQFRDKEVNVAEQPAQLQKIEQGSLECTRLSQCVNAQQEFSSIGLCSTCSTICSTKVVQLPDWQCKCLIFVSNSAEPVACQHLSTIFTNRWYQNHPKSLCHNNNIYKFVLCDSYTVHPTINSQFWCVAPTHFRKLCWPHCYSKWVHSVSLWHLLR
jgi:hypothetical protein